MGEPALSQPPSAPTSNETLPLGPPGRERAAVVAWDWKRDTSGDAAARARRLRTKGLIQSAVGLAISAVLYAFAHPVLAAVVATIATLTLLTAIASPTGAYATIERALGVFAGWVGQAAGWIVLTPVFLGFFLPFGLLFRRGARDPMQRRFEAARPSYWKEREPHRDIEEHHLSQF